MKSKWRVVSSLLALLLVGLGLVWTVPGQEIASGPKLRVAAGGPAAQDLGHTLPVTVTVSGPYTPTLSPAVRDLPPIDPDELPDLDREMARRDDHGIIVPDVQVPPHGNPLLELQQSVAYRTDGTNIVANFAGYQSGSSPPDDTGDVGSVYFLQGDNSSNSIVTIFDKSGVQQAQFYMQSLAPGSPCNNGYCDPVIQYDVLADRWFISEFDSTGNTLCFYVSETNDPTGSWYAYAFNPSNSGMQDYFKVGVWPDGYYVGVNNGGWVLAMERSAMLAGNPASMQEFDLGTLPGFGFQLTVPASVDGASPAPPSGAPAIFMRPVDTEIHTGWSCPSEPCDLMDMWELHVDWNNSNNSTLTQIASVQITEYDHTLCGTGSDWSCMPQPGTSQELDPIREPLHYPLQYRNFGTHETLVGCFAEDVDGSDRAAVHWFEIRRTPPGSGAWALQQDGVISSDDDIHRSVCSAAMDGSGNIVVGYTRTGPNAPDYPSIYYSARLSTDPLGTMPIFDQTIWDASSSKTNNERWGDYAGIGVDPADDCTIWFTTEYGGSGQSRVTAIKFDECGVADFTLEVTPESLDICAGDDAVYDVSVGSLNGFGNDVTLSSSGRPAGTTESFVPNPVTPAGSSVFTVGNTGGVTAGTSNITVGGTAQDSPGHQDTVMLQVLTEEPGVATAPSPQDGAIGVVTPVTFDWADVADATSYEIKIAHDPGFSDIFESAAGLTASSYAPSAALEGDTVYYWQVWAVNSCGAITPTTWAFHTAAMQCETYGPGETGTINDATGSNPVTTAFHLNVPDSVTVSDLDVLDLQGTHPDAYDLRFVLRSPGDVAVTLIPRMCSGSADFAKGLDDEAASALTCPLNDGATQRPSEALSAFDSRDSFGDWVLEVTNYDKHNTGELINWSLQICSGGVNAADYSDLATGYGIAWHTGDNSFRLGNNRTIDDPMPEANADIGDDGISFISAFQGAATVRINVQGEPIYGSYVRGWFDWNANGVFDAYERVCDRSVAVGDTDITVNVPSTVTQPINYRFRLYDSASAPSAWDGDAVGGATGGEVEDDPSPAPTAVRLVAFGARPAVGGVLVTWETVSEDGNVGFNLYRSDTPGILGEMLNETLIPSQAPGAGQGAAYDFLDETVLPGAMYYYTLEAVDVSDGRTLYGPAVTGLWQAYLPLVGR